MVWSFLSHFRTQEVSLLEKVPPAVCQGQGLAGSDLPGLFFFLSLAGQCGGAFHLPGGFISGLVCRG